MCEKYGATWLDDSSNNRADACNFALRQMDHDLVLFTDDDTIPPLDWVEKLIRWFEDPKVGAVGGPNFAPDDDSFGAKCADVAFCMKIYDGWNTVWSPAKRRISANISQSRRQLCSSYGQP